MKVLIVCSGKTYNETFDFKIDKPFTYEQIESLKKFGVEYDTYFIMGSGLFGYLKNYFALINKIKSYSPDLVHAHYGFSGLLASLQSIAPTVTTFHGSDINLKNNRPFSYIASKLSTDNIFVHPTQPSKIKYKKPANIIPCGVDMKIFFPRDKFESRKILGLENRNKYILFSSRFNNDIKNFQLAEKAISLLNQKVKLIELKGYSRTEVSLLLNAVDLLLLTSISEGSPQLIKEAMACNIPIVSTDVGDIKMVVRNTSGCYITSFRPEDVADKIKKALTFKERTTGRDSIMHLENSAIARKIIVVYKKVIENHKKRNPINDRNNEIS